MKRKYSLWQLIYLLAIKIVIAVIVASLLIPCVNFVIDRICETEHKEVFFDAHYRSEPQIFFEAILGIANDTEA